MVPIVVTLGYRDTFLFTAVFGGLYAAQGIAASMAQFVVPTVMRQSGFELNMIALVQLLFLPAVLKPLWAPAVDCYVEGNLIRRRGVIGTAQAALVVSFALAGGVVLDAETAVWLSALLFLSMFFVATQDMSTDALAIEATSTQGRNVVNGLQVAGTYAGFILCSMVWLPFYTKFGWAAGMSALALVFALIGLCAWFGSASFITSHWQADRSPTRINLLAPFKRSIFRRGLLLLLLFQIGGRAGVAVIGPFLVDQGYALATIGWITGTGMTAAGIIGGLCGPALLGCFGSKKLFVCCGLIHAAVFAILFGLDASEETGLGVLAVLIMIEAVAFALFYVALFTQMMNWSSPHQAGTDFAILQSTDTLIAIAAGALSIYLAGLLGYGLLFLAAAALLLVASLFAARRSDISDAPPIPSAQSVSL